MNAEKELELLQSIVNQWVGFSFKIRGWLLALITGLTVGYLSGKIEFGGVVYLAISASLIACFWIIDQSQRVVAGLAIKRMQHIEELLRSDHPYDGPRITESLLPALKPLFVLKEVFKASFQALSFIPYFVLLLLAVVLAWFGPSP